jgi:hypothetical protein
MSSQRKITDFSNNFLSDFLLGGRSNEVLIFDNGDARDLDGDLNSDLCSTSFFDASI